jgi:fructose-1-phosphate kinase PfkB-like protein
MKVTEIHNIDEYGGGKGSLAVTVVDDAGNRTSATIYAGEPEDATFFRDLNGAHNIIKLVMIAYEAGKRGESFEYEFIDENEEEVED